MPHAVGVTYSIVPGSDFAKVRMHYPQFKSLLPITDEVVVRPVASLSLPVAFASSRPMNILY